MKTIRNGKVAVLYSPGFGAGWYTWNDYHTDGDGSKREFLLFGDEYLISLIEAGHMNHALNYAKSVLGEDFYYGGFEDIAIEWLDVGTRFIITEYDGSESIQTENATAWETA